uniref:Putative monolaris n=1 Tax=Rhipicephalus pulchellus TaxID=72859 RepID=L7LPY6_RHIPC
MRIPLLTVLAFYITCFTSKEGDAVSTQLRCSSMPDQNGDCDDHFGQWYYDKKEQKCATLVYGDCPRNENIFQSEEECKQTCQNAGKVTSATGKGFKGRPPKPSDSSEETGVEGAKRPGNRGSEEESGKRKQPVRKPTPTTQRRRPKTQVAPKRREPPARRKRPQPPKQQGPSRPNCGVRVKPRRNCGGEYSGMWYNNGGFYICSRVPEGGCPTHGSFFDSCEECMQMCHRAKVNQCQLFN